jgi:hypothetical protein
MKMNIFDWDSLNNAAVDIAVEVAKGQAKGIAGIAADSLKTSIVATWKKLNWRAAENLYRENLMDNISTTKILGNPKPIKIDQVYTDVYVFDKISAHNRFPTNPNDIDSITSIHNGEQKRFSALDVVRNGENFLYLADPALERQPF